MPTNRKRQVDGLSFNTNLGFLDAGYQGFLAANKNNIFGDSSGMELRKVRRWNRTIGYDVWNYGAALPPRTYGVAVAQRF